MASDKKTETLHSFCIPIEKKNAAEATEMIFLAFEDTVTHKTCEKWFQRFRNGDFDLSDRQRPGQPKKFRRRGTGATPGGKTYAN